MEIRDWQGTTGQSWAAHWKRTDRSFSGLTERLLARTRDYRSRDIVDIGSGAGELSLALARGRPEAKVVGVDISEDLIAVARQRSANLANVQFFAADAAVWTPEGGVQPDLLVSRQGVMFFPDPPAAFAHFARYSGPGANVLFSCFRDIGDNPIFTRVSDVLPPPQANVDPRSPGPFAFADRGYVGSLLEGAGWAKVRFEAFDFAMVVGAGDDPVDDAVSYFTHIGPVASALAEMDDVERRQTVLRLRDLARDVSRDGVVALRAGAWIVSATKA